MAQDRDRSEASAVRVAVVGLGYWGPNLVRNLSDAPRAHVEVLCDKRPERLEAVGERFPHIRRVESYDEVLEDPSVDAVAIATPVSSHYELAAAALAAGKHAFVEKPLAHSAAAARDLALTAKRRGLVLMTGHTFVYSPPVVRVKELIESGELGEIYFVSMSRVNLGLHQPDVSVVWDLAPHDFSILRYWLGETPTQVAALSRACIIPGTPDVAFINLRFPSGTVAHVELAWLSPSKLRRTAIVGSEKMVVYDDTSNEPVKIFDSGASIPDPETFGEYQLTYRTGDIVSPKIDPVEPLSLEVEDFCAAILDGTPLRATPELAIDVLRAIEAVDRSLAADGVPVRLEDEPAPPEQDLAEALSPTAAPVPTEPGDPGRDDAPDDTPGVAVLGAGPAGLTAAYVLGKRGEKATVFEADSLVGGISKTVEFNGFRFDLGGHRFFTKMAPIQRFWEAVLGENFLTRPRLSRIYYGGKYYSYPLTAKDVLGRLGLWESMRCTLSYLLSKRKRRQPAHTFEDWVTVRFGKRLYDTFFRSYTEKLWGIPGSEIRSQWAAQRIRNFSLGKAILSILGLRREHVTTLIEEFNYPRRGPGQLWDEVREHVEELGVGIRLKERCVAVRHEGGRVQSIVVRSNGDTHEHEVTGLLSSIPLNELVLSLDPPPPEHVVEAARRLRYRDLCVVALMTTEKEPFADNWIYLHDPGTRAGRVQNYGAWSPDMVQPGTTCLGVEYFCFRGDDIWELSSEEAVELAKAEMARIGLVDPDKVFDGVKVLVPNAYPMYDSSYPDAVETLKHYLAGFENLKTFGRNGLHRYNNQDHSMWTAVLATVNLLEGTSYDVWAVNSEEVYLEEGAVVDAALGAELEHTGGARVSSSAKP
jgi:protoporphyrinogen oxidase/predicted dehydrogenase